MTTSKTLPSVLVVDDNPEIGRLLSAYLEQAGYKVLIAQDGETGLRMMHRELPSVVILDLMLPDRDGWDITRIARSDVTLKLIPVIMLTARVADADKIIGLELGADDYITKPFNPREVVARVRSVLRRTSPEEESRPQIIQCGTLRLDIGQHQVFQGDRQIELTPTEFNLLLLFMENPDYAFTRAELAEKLFGYNYNGLEHSLDSHIKNLRHKIQFDGKQTGLIQTIYGVGYRFAGS